MDEIKLSGTERAIPRAEETWTGPSFSPAADIFETDEALFLIAEMPGAAREDVNIDIEGDNLTISGRTRLAVGESESVISQEFTGGRYMRRFVLSEVINQAAIKASFQEGGVLRLTLPKVKQAQPRKIKVEAP
ncbi:MAG: Hsp20/alpha crystallin family protein [Pseudomonadota bacterium]